MTSRAIDPGPILRRRQNSAHTRTNEPMAGYLEAVFLEADFFFFLVVGVPAAACVC